MVQLFYLKRLLIDELLIWDMSLLTTSSHTWLIVSTTCTMWHRLMENEYLCEWTTLHFQSFHDEQYLYVSMYVPLSTKERTHVSQTLVLRINGCCCLRDQFDDRSDDTSLLSNYILLGGSRQSIDNQTLGKMVSNVFVLLAQWMFPMLWIYLLSNLVSPINQNLVDTTNSFKWGTNKDTTGQLLPQSRTIDQ